jgi:hypothetical protein
MAYIAPSVIEEMKQIDLLTYLRTNEPGELVKIGSGEYRMRSHDSLKISNGKWHQFSSGKGGKTALDYLIKVEGLSFTDAVSKLADRDVQIHSAHRPAERKKRTALILPEKHTDTSEVVRYLTQTRCLDAVIVNSLIMSGLIYENRFADPKSGRSFSNAVFLGTDMTGTPRQASVRGIGTLYKSEAPGSDKHFAFNIPSVSHGGIMRIFESAIDLISFMTLAKMHGKDPRADHMLSLSGIFRPKDDPEDVIIPMAIGQYLKDHDGIEKMIFHLDNDEPGREAMSAFKTVMTKFVPEVTAAPPKAGKDMNDWLRIISIHEQREPERGAR